MATTSGRLHFGWTVWYERKARNFSHAHFAKLIGEAIPGKGTFSVRQLSRIYESPVAGSQSATLYAVAKALSMTWEELDRKWQTIPVIEPEELKKKKWLLRLSLDLRTAISAVCGDGQTPDSWAERVLRAALSSHAPRPAPPAAPSDGVPVESAGERSDHIVVLEKDGTETRVRVKERPGRQLKTGNRGPRTADPKKKRNRKGAEDGPMPNRHDLQAESLA